jgi:hypothetical protein
MKLKRKSQMSIQLKIKSKHLSLESKVIRFEEKKIKKQIEWSVLNRPNSTQIVSLYNNIHEHRVYDVRNENRATYLARAFIAGKPYSSVEAKRKPEKETMFINSILPRVLSMVLKYGKYKSGTVSIDTIKAWLIK